uniref:nitrilase-related carbon-nitrogen hydrolase n=1 Tax=Fulvivirga sp. TaxID=1931237 RepID=UPI00404A4653
MQDLKVTLIQSDIHWQNAGANLAMFEEKIWLIEGKTDLIVLPEMFNTGFTMNAKQVAEPMNFTTFKWMKQMAAQTGAVVIGSVVIKEDKNYFNRLISMAAMTAMTKGISLEWQMNMSTSQAGKNGLLKS